MRRGHLARLTLVAALVAAPALANAETARTAEASEVLSRPGERGKVLVKVKKGQTLTVIGREGRWVKVRVSGRTGWIRRTSLEVEDDDGGERTTRRRPFVDDQSWSDDGAAPAPAKPTKPTKPSKPKKPDAHHDDEVAVADPPEGAHDDDGEVRTRRRHDDEPDDSDAAGPRRPRLLRTSASLGTRFLSGKTRTTGGVVGVPDNYDIGTTAFSVGIGGEVRFPYKRNYEIGASMSYAFALAAPGISYMGSSIGVSTHDFDLRLLGGYALHDERGTVLVGRLGVHFDAFRIPLDNAARIPAESLIGPTLGVGLEVPRLTSSLGASVALDSIFIGSRTQTEGLEDGSAPRTAGLWLDVLGRYQWRSNLTFDVGYRLTFLHNNFGAPIASSMRDHTGTEVTRNDLYHAFTLGLSRTF